VKTVSVPALPWEERKSPTGKFHSRYKNISIALGGKRGIGTWDGGHPFDLQMRSVPAGASVCPRHAHKAQWELFVIVSGRGIVRSDDEKHEVQAGDAFVQPPGTAHQITSVGPEDLVFYVIADHHQSDSVYYPDSEKWAMAPHGKIFRMQEVDYYDGED
jgi:uncharacterized cupin superfamily protein